MLPPIDTNLLPVDVRSAGPEATQLYSAALQFERMLVEQLTSQLSSTVEAADTDGEGAGAQASFVRGMLPGALADGVTSAGGIGLASQPLPELPGPGTEMTALLEHLDRQIVSSQRLLQSVLAQSDAIRDQDIEGLLARLGDIQSEMASRVSLEQERTQLLQTAGAQLGAAPDTLDLDALLALVPPADGEQARSKSAELRGLISEIGRVHNQNRIPIRQELAFLDHLLRALSDTPRGGYDPMGLSAVTQAVNSIDARA